MGADVALLARVPQELRGNPLVSRQPSWKPRPSEKSRHARRDERARKHPRLLDVSRPTFPHSALFSRVVTSLTIGALLGDRNPLRSSAFPPNAYSLAVTKKRGRTLDFWTFSEHRDERECDDNAHALCWRRPRPRHDRRPRHDNLGYRKKIARGKNKGNVALEHPEEVGTKATSTSPHLVIFARIGANLILEPPYEPRTPL